MLIDASFLDVWNEVVTEQIYADRYRMSIPLLAHVDGAANPGEIGYGQFMPLGLDQLTNIIADDFAIGMLIDIDSRY